MALEDEIKSLQHKGNAKIVLSIGCTVDGICICIESFLSRHRTSHYTLTCRILTQLSLVKFPCHSTLLIFLYPHVAVVLL